MTDHEFKIIKATHALRREINDGRYADDYSVEDESKALRAFVETVRDWAVEDEFVVARVLVAEKDKLRKRRA